jgi:EAL and modified HD-GYP domain-containing signal transduction protein
MVSARERDGTGRQVPGFGTTVCVARQRIVDTAGRVVAHELLFRPGVGALTSGADEGDPAFDDDLATASVINVVTTEFDLAEVVGEGLLFVNVPRSFVVGELPLTLSPGGIVLELLERVLVDDEVREGLVRLRAAGFRLALDDVVPDDPRLPLAELCDFVKVVLTDAEGGALPALADRLRALSPGVQLVAEHVETEQDRQRALAAGFTMLQGYLLSRPTVLRRDTLSHHSPIALALLGRLADPSTATARLAELAAADPALAAKLLRAVNNVTGVRLAVADLSRAITLLGRERLHSLLVLDLVSGIGHDDDELPLAAVARTRAAQALCPEHPLSAATEALTRLCAEMLGTGRDEVVAWLGVPAPDPEAVAVCDDLDVYREAVDRGEPPVLTGSLSPLEVSIAWLTGLAEGRELISRLTTTG